MKKTLLLIVALFVQGTAVAQTSQQPSQSDLSYTFDTEFAVEAFLDQVADNAVGIGNGLPRQPEAFGDCLSGSLLVIAR